MKRSMTTKQLIAAHKRIDAQISALYKQQGKLDDIAAKRCSLMVGDIVEVVEVSGRKHWGFVNYVDGTVRAHKTGWEAALRNSRKNGRSIGGGFRLREDGTAKWSVIERAAK